MTIQEHTAVGVPARSVQTIEAYDFRRPTTLAREHARVLELAFETFARQWGTQLTAKVRVISQVTCEQVVMQSYDEYASGLPATTAMVLCSIGDIDARAVIQFPTSAALTWVSYMLGSTFNQVAPERKFTAIEQALVRRLFDDALDDLRYSLGSLLLEPIAVDAIQYNSQFAQAAATSDLMIVASFAIVVGDSTTAATLALPAEVLLRQLGESTRSSTAVETTEMLGAQLGWVPVDVTLQLVAATVSPATILGLAVGDLLALPHPQHRPFDITVDGHRLGQAAIGANGARLAAVVVAAGTSSISSSSDPSSSHPVRSDPVSSDPVRSEEIQ